MKPGQMGPESVVDSLCEADGSSTAQRLPRHEGIFSLRTDRNRDSATTRICVRVLARPGFVGSVGGVEPASLQPAEERFGVETVGDVFAGP